MEANTRCTPEYAALLAGANVVVVLPVAAANGDHDHDPTPAAPAAPPPPAMCAIDITTARKHVKLARTQGREPNPVLLAIVEAADKRLSSQQTRTRQLRERCQPQWAGQRNREPRAGGKRTAVR